jgi:hypothetical protein
MICELLKDLVCQPVSRWDYLVVTPSLSVVQNQLTKTLAALSFLHFVTPCSSEALGTS